MRGVAPAARIVASFEVAGNFGGRTSFALSQPPETENQVRVQ